MNAAIARNKQLQEGDDFIKSPLFGVSKEAWTKFVELMGEPECAKSITKTGHLGLFLFSLGRLEKLGLLNNGDWVPPLTQDAFLSSPNVQYRTFERSCVLYFGGALNTLKPAEWFPNEPLPTISGLLAVAHRAGRRGLNRWLRSARDRREHPFTTATFTLCNGVF